MQVTLEVGDVVRRPDGWTAVVIAIVHDGRDAVIEDGNNNCWFIKRTDKHELIESVNAL